MKNFEHQQQRSLGWYRARLGIFTGSNIYKLIGKGRNVDFSQTALGYIYQVAAERNINELIIDDDDLFAEYLEQANVETRAMRFGIEMEDTVRRLFAREYSVEVKEVGSIKCGDCETLAASPDGVFEYEEGTAVLEIKCPTLPNYQKYRMTVKDNETLNKEVPEYYWQVQAEIMCTGAKTAFLAFYNPFHKEPLYIIRINADAVAFETIRGRVSLAEEFISKNNH